MNAEELRACRRRRRMRLTVTMSGFAIASPAMFGTLAPTTEIRLYIAGMALMILSGAIDAMQDRDRIQAAITSLLVVSVTFTVADKLQKRGDVESDVLTAVLIIVFFVIPLPLILAYFRSRQDELQRSLLTNAAGVAFLATLFASTGYAVLDAFGGFDPLPLIAVPIFAVCTWAAAWAALRWRVA